MTSSTAWPFWVSGALIGILVTLFALVAGKGFGVSSGYGTLCGLVSKRAFFQRKPYSDRWRLWFLVGLPLGGLLSVALAGSLQWKHQVGLLETLFGPSPVARAVVLLAGGFGVGYGARWAGGCTSGHSILGIAQGSRASIVATLGFMAAGFVVTNLLFLTLGR